MAEYSSEERNGHCRTTVKLEPGEEIHLCRCFQSKEFPICDGTHKTLTTDQGPVIVEALKTQKE